MFPANEGQVPPPLDLLPALSDGLATTLWLVLGGSLLAIAVAPLAGTGRWVARVEQVGRPSAVRAGSITVWSWISTVYVEVFRGTSALVQLFWFYFVLPRFGFDIGAMEAGILVLGLNTGAYGAEVVRGALGAVPAGQVQAARSLGFSQTAIFVRVILPQAAVRMIPPAGNLLIELLKNTALVSTIALSEITFRAQALRSETLRTVEIFGLTLVLYFVMAQAIALGTRFVERRLSVGTRFAGAPG